MIGMEGGSKSAGTGSVNRAEKVSLTIAAVVTDVLANGNLVIQGRQEVRTNREVRELTVAGIVRPEDISSANAINHTQIAEARISYGGRGDVSRVQAPPVGQALAERWKLRRAGVKIAPAQRLRGLHGVSCRLRCLLHRALHQFTDSRSAQRQGCR